LLKEKEEKIDWQVVDIPAANLIFLNKIKIASIIL